MLTPLLIFFILLYLIVIGLFVYGFDKVEDFKLQDLPAKTKFSIVIPFRNEGNNLPKLLDSIFNLNYPKTMFEVILVDDGSDDDSVSIIENILHTSRKNQNPRIDTIRIIQNERTSKSPKKDAITMAIKASKHNWIVTTDASCFKSFSSRKISSPLEIVLLPSKPLHL